MLIMFKGVQDVSSGVNKSVCESRWPWRQGPRGTRGVRAEEPAGDSLQSTHSVSVQTESEIAVLRQVLDAKVKRVQELKKQLSITPWKEFREDLEHGLQSIQKNTVFTKGRKHRWNSYSPGSIKPYNSLQIQQDKKQESSKMETNEIRAVIKYLCKKGMSPKEIYEDMVDTLREDAPSYSTVKKMGSCVQIREDQHRRRTSTRTTC
ncbi:hypothetical protein LAZ67_17002197 [Cordylochernes scorpioides]|uniref:Mos1 transposase HTH domain-containing protein n=1 Tax=Cordylochernes scorpioides TaxID=51811 RepID=A0ABY6LGN3_9ARAC|nr:hypothetical protein LAZ67_17002197 [Cordylochernes scorpioides]